MRQWLVPSFEDKNKIVIIGASFQPPNAILEAPIDPITGEPENPAWLVIQDQTDEQGNVKKVALVDKALKKQIRDQEKAARELEKAEREKEQDIEKDVRKFFKDFDKSSLASIEEIQDAIDSIVKALKLFNKSLKE